MGLTLVHVCRLVFTWVSDYCSTFFRNSLPTNRNTYVFSIFLAEECMACRHPVLMFHGTTNDCCSRQRCGNGC